MLGDPVDAEDVTQETFIEAYRCADRFRGRGKAIAWLLGIAVNRCRMWKRRRGQSEISLDALSNPHGLERGDAHSNPGNTDNPSDMRLDVERAVRGLPPKYRLPVVLRFQHELTDGEIAAVLGISRSAAAMRLHRAAGMLRERLRHLDPVEEVALG
jgi:RNA polymerase sigma-70 factor (ECF subfamily)